MTIYDKVFLSKYIVMGCGNEKFVGQISWICLSHENHKKNPRQNVCAILYFDIICGRNYNIYYTLSVHIQHSPNVRPKHQDIFPIFFNNWLILSFTLWLFLAIACLLKLTLIVIYNWLLIYLCHHLCLHRFTLACNWFFYTFCHSILISANYTCATPLQQYCSGLLHVILYLPFSIIHQTTMT